MCLESLRCLMLQGLISTCGAVQGAGRLMNANIGDLWMPTICLLGLFASLGAFHVTQSTQRAGAWQYACELRLQPASSPPHKQAASLLCKVNM